MRTLLTFGEVLGWINKFFAPAKPEFLPLANLEALGVVFSCLLASEVKLLIIGDSADFRSKGATRATAQG